MPVAFDAIAAMGDHLRHWVEAHGRSQPVPEGQRLIEAGVPDDHLCFLLEGTALVETSETQDSTPLGLGSSLALLSAGAMFGEMAFLDREPPVASVVAGPHCHVLVVSEAVLQGAMDRDPQLAREAYELFARKLAMQLREQNAFLHRWSGVAIEPLRQALLAFECLDDTDVTWLASHGQLRRLVDEEILIRQGDPASGLHIVLTGTALVSLSQDGRSKTVATVRQGEILGEMSLLVDEACATASVTAVGDLDVLSVDKTVLSSCITADPPRGARFYQAMAIMLCRWSRNQLLSHGLAAATTTIHGDGPGEASPADRRFARLRRQVGVETSTQA
jgi:CRP/FNR family cyclic AMP-dependent transcriptional regulator